MCICRPGWCCPACRILPDSLADLRKQYEQTKRELDRLAKELSIEEDKRKPVSKS